VRQLRREIGLRVQCDPVFKDKFSPDLVLALFSSTLAQPQPDWPKQTLQPGFVFFDREKAGVDDFPELAAFLAAGDAPIVFTLGSTAIHNPGNFYEASAAAARKLGKRAVLLGTVAPADADPAYLLALQYAPYSQIFPHGAAIVHQGGSGTTGQVMRAGRPQLIVPYGWDQPDNGARVARLGLGLCLARSEYLAQTAANTLETLLGNPQIAARASEVGEQIRSEDALTVACDAIEAVLTAQNPHRFQPDRL
jgi:UDP:flavonoid glycosyltransferase YjiC (YdhE family)